MAELADQALLSRSGMTRLVDRLERDGLLAAQPCEYDARGCYAALTAGRGRAAGPGAADASRRRPRPFLAHRLDPANSRASVGDMARLLGAERLDKTPLRFSIMRGVVETPTTFRGGPSHDHRSLGASPRAGLAAERDEPALQHRLRPAAGRHATVASAAGSRPWISSRRPSTSSCAPTSPA